VSADPKNPEDSPLPVRWSPSPAGPSPKFVRVAHLRKLRSCQQVAAVCFRIRNGDTEFLLVQTRGSGRWTFPKGGAEPGLTHAQSAALEAFEEAGVHGRMEEASFTGYGRRKRGDTRQKSSQRSSERGFGVNAYLCEVSRLSPPQEANRNPTWFSAEKAKRRLREDRAPDCGAELARVVDRAVARIRRLRAAASPALDAAQPSGPRLDRPRLLGAGQDALQKVRFIDDARRAAVTVRVAGTNQKIR